MGRVIELCRSCGFDIPPDADSCPACAPPVAPSRAARQVAGLDLPTRSVHTLPHLRPVREHSVQPLGPARTARSAYSLTTALAVLTFAAAGLHWASQRPRFVLRVPDGTTSLLDHITIVSATASIAALAIGLAATLLWCLRATARAIRGRVTRHHHA